MIFAVTMNFTTEIEAEDKVAAFQTVKADIIDKITNLTNLNIFIATDKPVESKVTPKKVS